VISPRNARSKGSHEEKLSSLRKKSNNEWMRSAAPDTILQLMI